MDLVITGAGISTAAGMPTFAQTRSLWDRQTAENDWGTFTAKMREFHTASLAAEPTALHRHLAQRKNTQWVTFNIDGLEVRAGAQGVVCAHGSIGSEVVEDHVYEENAPTWEGQIERVTSTRTRSWTHSVLLRPNVLLYNDTDEMVAKFRGVLDSVWPRLPYVDNMFVLGLSCHTVPMRKTIRGMLKKAPNAKKTWVTLNPRADMRKFFDVVCDEDVGPWCL